MIVSLLFISSLFVASILTIVMLGILIRSSAINRFHAKAFILFYLLILLRLFLNIYLAFLMPSKIIFTKANILLDLPLVIPFFYLKHRFPLKNLSENLLCISSLALVLTDIIFFFFYSWFLGALNLLSLLSFIILSYLNTLKIISK